MLCLRNRLGNGVKKTKRPTLQQFGHQQFAALHPVRHHKKQMAHAALPTSFNFGLLILPTTFLKDENFPRNHPCPKFSTVLYCQRVRKLQIP